MIKVLKLNLKADDARWLFTCRQEAREIIKNGVNASEDDAVIFAGQGCTGAIRKLISALDLKDPPIVFTSTSEHQDNLQIWEEIGAKIIRIAETKQNFLDLSDLEDHLKLHQHSGRQLIGCFSAASNVTGILVDDVASTMLLHKYGALAFWDYNLVAPYISINMNYKVAGVEENINVYKDAIYFSGHKFIGGVQTPGILVAKKFLFRRTEISDSESFFAPQEQNRTFEVQEEGSAAPVVESVRAGLIMQLKETITVANILMRQEKINKQVLQHIRTIPEIILLGNASTGLKRIPVFSFMVRHPRGTFLHHNFVCAVLNDIFGIQARGGCPCSGAYAQELLGIDQNLADQYENIILEDRRLSSLNLSMNNLYLELLRPGFTRISLPYFISDAELAFVMEAVKMVATEGWKLLPQYIVDLDTGEWRHHTNTIQKDRKWLGSIRYVDGKMTMNERRISGPGLFPQNYSECLQTARNLFNRARKTALRNPYEDQGMRFDSRAENLRWFMLPHEAQSILTSNAQNVKHTVPFDPRNSCTMKRSDSAKDGDKSGAKSNNSSPRHYSLSAMDDPRLITCSSPLPYFVQDGNTLYYSNPYVTSMHQPVNFAVGESVNAAILEPIPNSPHFFRERCLSLGAPTVSPPVLSPQTRISLGIHQQRQRNCSCSSQTDLHSLDSDINTSPTHSLNILSNSFDYSMMGRASPAPDLQTYVTEVTKELATNIKSEIREVISKVEDALECSDTVDMNALGFNYDKQGSSSEDGRSDSISANEVAEYIEKVSKEMANEVKSEIRDVVSAVDVYFTPERRCFSRASSSGDSEKVSKNDKSDKYTPGSSSETVIQMIKKSSSSSRLSDEELSQSTEKPCQNKLLTSNVTSVSSQDSGINLSFHELEHGEYARRSSAERQPFYNEKLKKRTLHRHSENSDSSESDKSSNESVNSTKWICPPKSIWQPTVEAMQEYEMIRNGDKIMICLSGGKDSLTLLHALLQYQSMVLNKGVVFTIAAVIIDPEASGCDPCILIPHLKALGVHYIINDESDLIRNRGE
ncbi:sulfurtransferase-related [Holotrichia oblita]|uniref:Sulfurtransferase-related n=1 Tax=Holotrichia oblita TaxID=644536 RepID=A0ACB9T7P3_HOLOL|nr:sulfurtransferase-related [Holotrichia oblita]